MNNLRKPNLQGLEIENYTPGQNLIIKRKPYIGSFSMLFANIIIISFLGYHTFTNYQHILLLPLSIYIWLLTNTLGGNKITINTQGITWRRFWFPFIKRETHWKWTQIKSIFSTSIDPVTKRSYYQRTYRLIVDDEHNRNIIFRIRDVTRETSQSRELNKLLQDFKKLTNPALKDRPESLKRPFIILGIIFTIAAALTIFLINFNPQ